MVFWLFHSWRFATAAGASAGDGDDGHCLTWNTQHRIASAQRQNCSVAVAAEIGLKILKRHQAQPVGTRQKSPPPVSGALRSLGTTLWEAESGGARAADTTEALAQGRSTDNCCILCMRAIFQKNSHCRIWTGYYV